MALCDHNVMLFSVLFFFLESVNAKKRHVIDITGVHIEILEMSFAIPVGL